MARRFQEITEVYRQEIAALRKVDYPAGDVKEQVKRTAGIISCPLRSRCWYTHSARTQRLCWR